MRTMLQGLCRKLILYRLPAYRSWCRKELACPQLAASNYTCWLPQAVTIVMLVNECVQACKRASMRMCKGARVYVQTYMCASVPVVVVDVFDVVTAVLAIVGVVVVVIVAVGGIVVVAVCPYHLCRRRRYHRCGFSWPFLDFHRCSLIVCFF